MEFTGKKVDGFHRVRGLKTGAHHCSAHFARRMSSGSTSQTPYIQNHMILDRYKCLGIHGIHCGLKKFVCYGMLARPVCRSEPDFVFCLYLSVHSMLSLRTQSCGFQLFQVLFHWNFLRRMISPFLTRIQFTKMFIIRTKYESFMNC